MKHIAKIHTDFSEKFGAPRQSGLVKELKGRIVFEPEFRSVDAVRGLEDFSHIWLIWEFSESPKGEWSPTVRPPILGGNERLGVFATRAPFRSNPIGLSSLKLDKIEICPDLGPVLHVSGVDMIDGTPVLDIKPYIPRADSHPEATGGFTDKAGHHNLEVDFPENLLDKIPVDKKEALIKLLSLNPKPAYQNDPERIYGLQFAGMEVHFRIEEGRCEVVEVSQL